MTKNNERHAEAVDDLTVFQAYDALQQNGIIKCRNGCYEPREVNRESLEAAAHLPRCEECGAVHIVTWDSESTNQN